MALSILDGNQSATTLSTILSSGQHITAHTVVSLGTQAITDMRSAVSGSVVSIPSLPAISGTVTANLQPQQSDDIDPSIKFFPTGYAVRGEDGTLDYYEVASSSTPIPVYFPSNYPIPAGTNRIGVVTIGSIPNGALTTRFGSIATANMAFATTAVTNDSRKYLLIQNIASTVITAGIGFTPTTTQGIQIVAGATITFDGNYIPTGAVLILSSVTSSNFTLLEA
jgi:hypothetical protein